MEPGIQDSGIAFNFYLSFGKNFAERKPIEAQEFRIPGFPLNFQLGFLKES